MFQMLLRFDGAHQVFSKGGALDSAVAEAAEMKKQSKTRVVPYIPPVNSVPGQIEMLPSNTYVPFSTE